MTAASGPGAGGRRNWRKLNNALHRDVGYLIVGLTIVYAVALLFVAATGLFVLKGKTGITGRGAWLTAVGIVIPVACWFLLRAL